MKRPVRIIGTAVVLAGLTACGAATASGIPQVAGGEKAAAPASRTNNAAALGPNNAITDVAGIEVGQVQKKGNGYLTGTTVVHTPDKLTVAGVDVSGGAPGTVETDLLSPENSNPGANAILLGGGSAYGLSARSGIMKWLEEKGQGFDVGSGVVPIVPGAIIFDLNRGGKFGARPTASWGYDAIEAAKDGAVAQGTIGAGTGARAGGLKGGVGTASIELGNGTTVAALVVVNAAGSTLAQDCSLLGAPLGVSGEFQGLKTPSQEECQAWKNESGQGSQPANTTIAVVATDAHMEKAAAAKLASVAHDGMARAINPVHSLYDGDTVFTLATGSAGEQLEVNDPAAGQPLNAIFEAGANVLSRAIVHAMLEAESAGGMTSYCDQFPSACASLDK